MQWIQRAIVQGHYDQTLTIPPPILSRTFHDRVDWVNNDVVPV